MTTEATLSEHKSRNPKVVTRSGGSDSVYSIGMIGAWVYYIRRATTNQERVKGFLKGLVWPAFLVHDLFGYLNKEKA